MTGCSRGDVVLVGFVFSDEAGETTSGGHTELGGLSQGREEAIIAAITSRTDRILVGDHLIAGWQAAGLLFPSVVTGIIRTMKQGMIAKKLGTMPNLDMQAVEGNLRDALGLRSV